MKVGDLVRCKVTMDAKTVGVITSIEPATHRLNSVPRVCVLTDGRIHHWSIFRLEVISESR